MTGFAGEAYLEQVLERIGIGVIRPEKFSIAEQMATYRAAQTLMFAEGSALHGAQLLGRALGDVVAICPPLIISEDQVDELFTKLERALDDTLAWVH